MTLHTIRLNAISSYLNGSTATPTTTTCCVFVHGLDSYSGTWTNTMEALMNEADGTIWTDVCVAVDQRGCGKSPDLYDNAFLLTQDALVEDLHTVITTLQQQQQQVAEVKTEHSIQDKTTQLDHVKTNIVLVGHSLGGRIVLGYAARYPDILASVVVEDMDIEPRSPMSSPIPIPIIPSNTEEEEGATGCDSHNNKKYFSRKAKTKEELNERLLHHGYDQKRLDEWWNQGRLEVILPKDVNDVSSTDESVVWSNVNPDFRRLCYEHVLSTTNGERDCRQIATKAPTLSCHLMVAGPAGTICSEESIMKMKQILGHQLTVHRYSEAGHSIHGSAKEAFIKTLKEIIEETKRK